MSLYANLQTYAGTARRAPTTKNLFNSVQRIRYAVPLQNRIILLVTIVIIEAALFIDPVPGIHAADNEADEQKSKRP